QVLEIMKDSRLGTYGTMAIVIGVPSRAIAIGSIAESNLLRTVATIAAAAAIGRIAIVSLMTTTAPVTDRKSQAKDVSGTQSVGRAIVAICLSIPFWIAWLVMTPVVAASSLLCVAVLLWWYRGLILRRVGGTTGDLLGASGFIAQLIVVVGATTK
ncbi:MAG: adenosylcobinamide-GDP ribazoletransferase, partial [Planctomycetota bacterium]